MSHVDPGPLSSYNSLTDPHLTGFFSNTRMKKYLCRQGLITRRGQIVSEATYRLNMARKEHKKHVKNLLASAIVHKTLDMERHRQVEIKRKLEEIAKIELVRRVREGKTPRLYSGVVPWVCPPSQPYYAIQWEEVRGDNSDEETYTADDQLVVVTDTVGDRSRQRDEAILPYLTGGSGRSYRRKSAGDKVRSSQSREGARSASPAVGRASTSGDKSEENLLPLISHPGWAKRGRPVSGPTPRNKTRKQRSTRPYSAPVKDNKLSSNSGREGRSLSNDDGRPESRRGTRHRERGTDELTRHDLTKQELTGAELDTRNLTSLDTVALRKYAYMLSKHEQGLNAVSPYLMPQVGYRLPSPPKSPRGTARSRNSRRRQSPRDSMSARSLSPGQHQARGDDIKGSPRGDNVTVDGQLIIHRQEPAMKGQEKVQSFCTVSIKYHGKKLALPRDQVDPYQEVLVEQQHCGGNTLHVFKEKLLPGSTFRFISRRHRGYPFSLSLYIDGIMDCRVSSCCEFKHVPGAKLGGKQGHFSLVGVTGSAPCYRCQVEKELRLQRKTKKKSKTKAEATSQDDQEEITEPADKEEEETNIVPVEESDSEGETTRSDDKPKEVDVNGTADDKNDYEEDFEDEDDDKEEKTPEKSDEESKEEDKVVTKVEDEDPQGIIHGEVEEETHQKDNEDYEEDFEDENWMEDENENREKSEEYSQKGDKSDIRIQPGSTTETQDDVDKAPVTPSSLLVEEELREVEELLKEIDQEEEKNDLNSKNSSDCNENSSADAGTTKFKYLDNVDYTLDSDLDTARSDSFKPEIVVDNKGNRATPSKSKKKPKTVTFDEIPHVQELQYFPEELLSPETSDAEDAQYGDGDFEGDSLDDLEAEILMDAAQKPDADSSVVHTGWDDDTSVAVGGVAGNKEYVEEDSLDQLEEELFSSVSSKQAVGSETSQSSEKGRAMDLMKDSGNSSASISEQKNREDLETKSLRKDLEPVKLHKDVPNDENDQTLSYENPLNIGDLSPRGEDVFDPSSEDLSLTMKMILESENIEGPVLTEDSGHLKEDISIQDANEKVSNKSNAQVNRPIETPLLNLGDVTQESNKADEKQVEQQNKSGVVLDDKTGDSIKTSQHSESNSLDKTVDMEAVDSTVDKSDTSETTGNCSTDRNTHPTEAQAVFEEESNNPTEIVPQANATMDVANDISDIQKAQQTGQSNNECFKVMTEEGEGNSNNAEASSDLENSVTLGRDDKYKLHKPDNQHTDKISSKVKDSAHIPMGSENDAVVLNKEDSAAVVSEKTVASDPASPSNCDGNGAIMSENITAPEEERAEDSENTKTDSQMISEPLPRDSKIVSVEASFSEDALKNTTPTDTSTTQDAAIAHDITQESSYGLADLSNDSGDGTENQISQEIFTDRTLTDPTDDETSFIAADSDFSPPGEGSVGADSPMKESASQQHYVTSEHETKQPELLSSERDSAHEKLTVKTTERQALSEIPGTDLVESVGEMQEQNQFETVQTEVAPEPNAEQIPEGKQDMKQAHSKNTEMTGEAEMKGEAEMTDSETREDMPKAEMMQLEAVDKHNESEGSADKESSVSRSEIMEPEKGIMQSESKKMASDLEPKKIEDTGVVDGTQYSEMKKSETEVVPGGTEASVKSTASERELPQSEAVESMENVSSQSEAIVKSSVKAQGSEQAAVQSNPHAEGEVLAMGAKADVEAEDASVTCTEGADPGSNTSDSTKMEVTPKPKLVMSSDIREMEQTEVSSPIIVITPPQMDSNVSEGMVSESETGVAASESEREAIASESETGVIASESETGVVASAGGETVAPEVGSPDKLVSAPDSTQSPLDTNTKDSDDKFAYMDVMGAGTEIPPPEVIVPQEPELTELVPKVVQEMQSETVKIVHTEQSVPLRRCGASLQNETIAAVEMHVELKEEVMQPEEQIEEKPAEICEAIKKDEQRLTQDSHVAHPELPQSDVVQPQMPAEMEGTRVVVAKDEVVLKQDSGKGNTEQEMLQDAESTEGQQEVQPTPAQDKVGSKEADAKVALAEVVLPEAVAEIDDTQVKAAQHPVVTPQAAEQKLVNSQTGDKTESVETELLLGTVFVQSDLGLKKEETELSESRKASVTLEADHAQPEEGAVNSEVEIQPEPGQVIEKKTTTGELKEVTGKTSVDVTESSQVPQSRTESSGTVHCVLEKQPPDNAVHVVGQPNSSDQAEAMENTSTTSGNEEAGVKEKEAPETSGKRKTLETKSSDNALPDVYGFVAGQSRSSAHAEMSGNTTTTIGNQGTSTTEVDETSDKGKQLKKSPDDAPADVHKSVNTHPSASKAPDHVQGTGNCGSSVEVTVSASPFAEGSASVDIHGYSTPQPSTSSDQVTEEMLEKLSREIVNEVLERSKGALLKTAAASQKSTAKSTSYEDIRDVLNSSKDSGNSTCSALETAQESS